jgi:predicted alpha/beta hydrolase
VAKLIHPEKYEWCTILVTSDIKDVPQRSLEVLNKQYPKADIDIIDIYRAMGHEQVLYDIAEDIGVVELYDPDIY